MRSAERMKDTQATATKPAREDSSSAYVPYTERLVVAPCDGRFVPLPSEVFTADGQWVEKGSRLGEIHSHGQRTPVISRFQGWMMGVLAVPGQPVHQGDALFWIWSS